MSKLSLINLKKRSFVLMKSISSFFPSILNHVDDVSQGSFFAINKDLEKEIAKLTEEKKMLLELVEVLKVYGEELRETL
jgi:hypothetical protein